MTSRFEVNARLRIIPLHTRFWRKLAKLSLQAYRVRSTFQKIAHEIKRNKNHLGFFTYRARKAMSSCFLSRPAASLRQNFGKIEGPSPRQRSVMIAISLIREGFRSLQRGSPRAVHDRSWIREWAQRGRVKISCRGGKGAGSCPLPSDRLPARWNQRNGRRKGQM